MVDIFDFWGNINKTPRDSQLIALDWIERTMADNPNIKYFFLEVPVGGGKSMIGLTLSNFLNKANTNKTVILTPQKILQKQYESEFNITPLVSLYGRQNYKCSKGTNCDIGASFGRKCKECPYEAQRTRAMAAYQSVMNYDLYLSLREYSEEYSPTKHCLVVCDEAHRLESFLTEFNSFEMSAEKAHYYNISSDKIPQDVNAIKTYLRKRVFIPIVDKIEEIENEHPWVKNPVNELSQSEGKILTQYKLSIEDRYRIQSILDVPNEEFDFIYTITATETGYKIKNTFGAQNFSKLIEPHTKHMLLMSSTIIDYESVCIELGIDPNQAAYLTLPSEFNKSKRPNVYIPTANMNAKWKSNIVGQKAMIDQIIDLLDIHSDQNGIIHTCNYEIAKWLVDELRFNNTHEIYHHNEGNRDQVIQRFMTDSHKTKLLISPSITEGLDLKGDLGRFAIFAKIPYPYLGDQWIKKRAEIDQQWYLRQTVTNIIQGSGRIVRDKEDEGVTYILDTCWEHLYDSAKHLFPKWWKDALIYCDGQ